MELFPAQINPNT